MVSLAAMSRWALRAVALAAVVGGIAGAPRRGAETPDPARRGAAVPAPGEEQWALRVDGWVIHVDRGAVAVPRPAVETPAEATPAAVRLQPLWISSYDPVIRHHAAAEGVDWRLVAALMYEESRFVADSVSPVGAYGLMQIMPIAAADVGAEAFHAPDDNIRTGVRYLKRLEQIFHEARGRDRLALVLAAYNAGPGHVQDAQTLARRFGYDPHRWENSMNMMMPLLEDPAYYQALPSGYADGQATVTYVERILIRYERYKVQAGGGPVAGDGEDQAAGASG